MTADDDHRAGRGRIVRNAFAEKQFRVRSGVHDETGGGALVFDIDGPAVVRLRILLLLNMLIAVFVSGGMRRSSQFRLNLGRPFAEIMEDPDNLLLNYGAVTLFFP